MGDDYMEIMEMQDMAMDELRANYEARLAVLRKALKVIAGADHRGQPIIVDTINNTGARTLSDIAEEALEDEGFLT